MKFMGRLRVSLSTLTLFLSVSSEQAAASVIAKNIVIVHGAFADGSGWDAVYRVLTKDGYKVTIVQNPLVSLSADVTATANVLASQEGPVVLVGHSYGGAVITQAGNDSNVKSLVYVAAFVPDAGESLQSLTANPDPNFAAPPILPPQNGFLMLDRAKFPQAFAGDVASKRAEFMAASQAALGVQAYSDKITTAAWKTKPSSYIVASDDHMIPPAAERKMAERAKSDLFELKASHAVYMSHPNEVAKIIEKAASK